MFEFIVCYVGMVIVLVCLYYGMEKSYCFTDNRVIPLGK